MVPEDFANFFIASASTGAALVGLLFVAVSLAPEQIVTRRAPVLLLDMVDNSISSCKHISGWFAPHSTVQIWCFNL